MQILQPAGWPRPKGYSNGVVGRGRIVFIAGQIGWDQDHLFHDQDFAGQFERALANMLAVLAEAGGRPEHLARMTWFITSKEAYLAQAARVGEIYRSAMGRHYPAMSVVEVSALVEDRAVVEIEATAILPD
jgi:enamine deaminase RidA (YjgF/YER057c/UK114 family)